MFFELLLQVALWSAVTVVQLRIMQSASTSLLLKDPGIARIVPLADDHIMEISSGLNLEPTGNISLHNDTTNPIIKAPYCDL